MVYNAADRKNVRLAEKQSKRAARERRVVIATVMASASGRQWFYEILTTCHVFATSFSLDTKEMAFKEGERNIGLMFLTELMRTCPNEYMLMMREANERDSVSEQRLRADSDRGDQGSEPDAADDGGGAEAGSPD